MQWPSWIVERWPVWEEKTPHVLARAFGAPLGGYWIDHREVKKICSMVLLAKLILLFNFFKAAFSSTDRFLFLPRIISWFFLNWRVTNLCSLDESSRPILSSADLNAWSKYLQNNNLGEITSSSSTNWSSTSSSLDTANSCIKRFAKQ